MTVDDFPFAKLASSRFSVQVASRIESLILERRSRLGDRLPPGGGLAISFGVSGMASSMNIAFQTQDCTSAKLYEARWHKGFPMAASWNGTSTINRWANPSPFSR